MLFTTFNRLFSEISLDVGLKNQTQTVARGVKCQTHTSNMLILAQAKQQCAM